MISISSNQDATVAVYDLNSDFLFKADERGDYGVESFTLDPGVYTLVIYEYNHYDMSFELSIVPTGY
ncbi:MAG: hypothetical protein IT416_04225 [Candidatus Pacebacteria bacterium]|nr:hypothetical protein [Candidatus Paceibacterota bacterium]